MQSRPLICSETDIWAARCCRKIKRTVSFSVFCMRTKKKTAHVRAGSTEVRIAVFASGAGSNFQAIVDAAGKHRLGNARVTVLITDREDAPVRRRARRKGIKELFVDPAGFVSQAKYEDRLIAVLEQEKIDIVALAGYMRILGKKFVRRFKHRMVNIHPALLPLFRGAHAIEDAYRAGVQETGVTVHFVDEKVDHGPVILQESVRIEKDDSLESLEAKIHCVEHRLYPRVLRLLAEGRVRVEGKKVIVKKYGKEGLLRGIR